VFEGSQTVRCWGGNGSGQLGINNTTSFGDDPGEMPAPNALVGAAFDQVDSGTEHVCALLGGASVVCWGGNTYGQLGLGNTASLGDAPGELPAVGVGGLGPIAQISAHQQTCVVHVNGSARCWGRNSSGALGLGNTSNLGDGPGEMPPPLLNLGGPVASISTGGSHVCALMQTGRVRCWGENFYGSLGIGTSNDIGDNPGEMPPPEADTGPGTVVQVGVGGNFTCALIDDGSVRCWGFGAWGQLGGANSHVGNSPGDMPPPIVNVGGNVVQIAVGGSHTCALLDNGAVRCWGDNSSGKLGYGHVDDIGDQLVEMPPANVNVGGPATQVFVSDGHSCALLVDGTLRCWGAGSGGRLGYGNNNNIGDQPGEMPPAPVPLW
jgi:alpha-tubulin suppressor-like RCC1 family protein